METTRKTLSIHEYRKLKAEEAVNKKQPLLKSEEEALRGNPQSETIKEEEEDPSLQVDYEEGESNSPLPTFSSMEKIPRSDSSLETTKVDDPSDKASSKEVKNPKGIVSSNTEVNLKEEIITSHTSADQKETLPSEGEDTPLRNVSSPLLVFNDEEVAGECFSSKWPWYDDALRHQRLVDITTGTPEVPSYGDARGFKFDPRDLDTYGTESNSLYYQILFWKSKYFDNKRLSNDH